MGVRVGGWVCELLFMLQSKELFIAFTDIMIGKNLFIPTIRIASLVHA